MDNALVVVNPAARHGETGKLGSVIEQLLANFPHDTVMTEKAGHATELARTATGYDAVVAVGGDGTAHEVLNGLMAHPRESRPAFGLLPTGSGNDTSRTLGIPTDLARAALSLATGERHAFDVGVCNGVYFNSSFAAGLDAKVTAKAIEYKVTKKRDGLWLYLTALMYVLFHEFDSVELQISFDGAAPVVHNTLIVAVTNGATYGGGFFITPDAAPDDGLFDVCMIDPLSLPEALMRLPFVVIGKHTKMKPVHMSRHSSLVIAWDRPLPAQIDGEVLLESKYDVSILPRAIECIVPRRAS